VHDPGHVGVAKLNAACSGEWGHECLIWHKCGRNNPAGTDQNTGLRSFTLLVHQFETTRARPFSFQ
jgi:hypothetical protein